MAYRRTSTRTRRATTRRTVSRRSTTRRASNGGNPWSPQDIAFMRKNYRNHSTAWCARQLGRTVYSVRYKASDLNIKKANPSKWIADPKSPSRWNAPRKVTPKKRFVAKKRQTTRRIARRRNW